MLGIIIPVYRARNTINNLFDSLLAQTKKMFLVTCVQDCDDEEYEDILMAYKARGLHIKWIKNEQNLGPGLTRQAGIDANIQCDYLMFADADDILSPRAVEILYSKAKSSGADVVRSKIIVEKRHDFGHEINNKNNGTWLHGKIYRAAFLKENDIRFPDKIRYNEDVYFNSLALNLANKVEKIDEALYIWRDDKNSITRGTGRTPFYNYSSNDFIYAKLTSLLKLKEHNRCNDTLILNTIKHVYINSQNINGFNLFIEPQVEDLITKFLCDEEVIRIISNKTNFLRLSDHMPASYEYYGKVYFFREPFDEWFKRYTDIDIMEKIYGENNNC